MSFFISQNFKELSPVLRTKLLLGIHKPLKLPLPVDIFTFFSKLISSFVDILNYIRYP